MAYRKDLGYVYPERSDEHMITVKHLRDTHFDENYEYLDKSLNELKEKLGDVHADIGSGFYIPAYITENGYLIYFEVENDILYEIVKLDLLTNEVIDRQPQ